MPSDRLFWIVGAAAFILFGVLQAGLWYFKRWARLLSSLSVVAALAIPWYQGAPEIRPASVSLFTELMAMITGAVLVFAWGVLRQEFGGPPYPLEKPSVGS